MKEPRIHELKVWPEPFQAIIDGRKKFEFRRDDRGFAVGDTLYLREYDPGESHSFEYSGREAYATVTYRLGSEFGVPAGYCVLSIEVTEKRTETEI